MLAPQVFEVMLNELEKDYSEDNALKNGVVEDQDVLEIYSMHYRLQQSETIKARVSAILLWFYEAEFWENDDPPKNPHKEFKKYFIKIENASKLHAAHLVKTCEIGGLGRFCR